MAEIKLFKSRKDTSKYKVRDYFIVEEAKALIRRPDLSLIKLAILKFHWNMILIYNTFSVLVFNV